MGGELLTSPKGGEQSPPVKYSEVFREHFPYYLAVGMTTDEYWNGDCTLTRYYRKAWEIKRKESNNDLWLQGLYIYEALLCASPMFRDLVKKAKPLPYPEEPYALTKKEQEERQKSKDELNMETGLAKVKAWANRVNNKKSKETKDA